MSARDAQLLGLVKRYMTDPRELPIYIIPISQLYLKTANGVNTTCSDVNAAAFFNAVALRGAQASVSVADTYVTCANLSGRGRLYYVLPPTYAGGLYTPTVRLTIDGTVYTLAPSTTIGGSYRMVVGACTPGVPSVNTGSVTTSDFTTANSYNDIGFNSALNGGFFTNAGNIGIVPPETAELFNMPFIQFDTSCLIEFKTSLLATTTGNKIGGAVYRMLP